MGPLSFAQERLWFIENYEGGTNAYNIPLLQKLSPSIDLASLEKGLQAVISRHEVLHSLIKIDSSGDGYQEVIDLTILPLEVYHHVLATATELNDLVSMEANHIFSLNTAYPIRVHILEQQNPAEKYLLIVVHHIAFDGWSMDVFLRDLQAYYNYYVALQTDQGNQTSFAILPLPELSIQYKDFAVWQRNYLSGERLQQQLDYWKNKLRDYEELQLPTDRPRPAEINYTGEDALFSINQETSLRLRALAKEHEVSLYTVLLAGFNLLLRSYSNQNDIVVGTPIANRNYPQLEDLVGFFVNNLALRSIISAEKTLTDYLTEIGQAVIEAQLHQDLPFERLVTELDVPKDPSRHPIFQVMFGVQSFGHHPPGSMDNLFTRMDLDVHYQVAKFDLSVFIDDNQTELHGVFNYAKSLFKKETITALIATYQHILEQLANTPSIRIKELNYLDPSSEQKIIHDWNQTETDYPANKTIHQLFEEQVHRTPDHIAVVYADRQLTYRELNEKANQLAHYLKQSYRLEGDDLIALCLERSEQMLMAILAVLKSGAAYVPIDPDYPEERIGYILADTGASVILTQEAFAPKLTAIIQSHGLSTQVESINSPELQNKLNAYQETNLPQQITSRNLAYVIYTSGTTGKPKGVALQH